MCSMYMYIYMRVTVSPPVPCSLPLSGRCRVVRGPCLCGIFREGHSVSCEGPCGVSVH